MEHLLTHINPEKKQAVMKISAIGRNQLSSGLSLLKKKQSGAVSVTWFLL